MATPDFDPTVFLAALAAGPIVAIATFYGIKLHYDEVKTGVEPSWSGRYIWGLQLVIWPLIYLSFQYWFFWNLFCILIGLFMTTMGTYLIGRWLYPRLLGPRQPQHSETED